MRHGLFGPCWRNRNALPDLGPSFSAQPITAGNSQTVRATAGQFTITPGVYVLSAALETR